MFASILGSFDASATALSAGYAHACRIDGAGNVDCWGWNGGGQLGAAGASSRVATRVQGLPANIAAIASGALHTCAVDPGGSVLCWGNNNAGALGRDADSQVPGPTPAPVAGLSSPVTAISGTRAHTCVIAADGGVQCWGLNEDRQLGNVDAAPGNFSAKPVTVPLGPAIAMPPVRAIATGWSHTCAIDHLGDVRCWGLNSEGQGGIDPYASPTIELSAATPPPSLAFASDASVVGVGAYHTCALLDAGEVQCWGWNGEGELGDGATTSSFNPRTVAGLDGTVAVTQLAAGEFHTCALVGTTEIRCWGDNAWGQLGDGTVSQTLVPVVVKGMPDEEIASLSAGSDFTCASVASGATYCWGDHRSGALGAGGQLYRARPALVQGLPEPIIAIESGNVHTCALGQSGSVSCWGRNHDAQIGDGSGLDRPLPVEIAGIDQPPTRLAAGAFHNCVSSSTGRVQCWGLNHYGQLGDGTLSTSATPSVAFQIAPAPTLLAAGGVLQSCAATDVALHCWGGRFGLQASGAPTPSVVPYSVVPGAQLANVALGEEHGCTLSPAGRVSCWGNNFTQQLGEATAQKFAPGPLPLPGLPDADAITAGRWHSCVVAQTGAIQCWGGNLYDTLGDGVEGGGVGASSSAPVTVSGFDGTSAETRAIPLIASRWHHTCAVNRLNQVKCWGLADAGQLGNQPHADGTFAFTQPGASKSVSLDFGTIVDLAVGAEHSCALSQTGAVACWGDTTYGQLGNGELGYSARPVQVLFPLFSDGFESLQDPPATKGLAELHPQMKKSIDRLYSRGEFDVSIESQKESGKHAANTALRRGPGVHDPKTSTRKRPSTE